MILKKDEISDKKQSSLDDEVDLIRFIQFFVRNWKLISRFAASGLVFACVLALATKRTWKGEFQIVLSSPSKPLISGLSPSFSQLERFGISSAKPQLNTQVETLKSSSVLMNIFEYVKNQKEQKSETKIKDFRFEKWKKDSLDIKLLKDTSVLNIAYKDNDKTLIFNVLNKISSKYQDYSGRKRKRIISLGLDYYENQLENYQKKSKESMKEVQTFAIEQDLLISPDFIDTKSLSPIDLNLIRVSASNEIKEIDQLLLKVNNATRESFPILSNSFLIDDFSSLSNLFSNLNDIDFEIENLRSVYLDSDYIIKDKIRQRNIYIEFLRKQIFAVLQNKKEYAQSIIKATESPNFIKYAELLNKARKDILTLNKLEDQNRSLLLEEARKEDPWDLITKPTLFPNPVGPRRKIMALNGLLTGIFFGSLIAFIDERRKNKIVTFSEMRSYFSCPILDTLSISERGNWKSSLELIAKKILSSSHETIGLLVIGEIDQSLIDLLDNTLSNFIQGRKIVISSDLIDILNTSTVIIVTAIGITKRDDLSEINQKLQIQNQSITGLIILK